MKTHSTSAQLNYLDKSVSSSLYRNGNVYTIRDKDGSDKPYQGATLDECSVPIHNARNLKNGRRRLLDRHGFEFHNQPLAYNRYNFFDNQNVILNYYPECADLVKQATNASKVFPFDYNVRWVTGKENNKRISCGGQKVQGPIQFVHGDYTLESAPQRIRELTKPPGTNDTLRPFLKNESLLDFEYVSNILGQGKRFALINVWRNIDSVPVQNHPLALCNRYGKSNDDLVVFEIHYEDRIGENYFAKFSPSHEWWYYPNLSRDEAILIKQWDSAGEFAKTNGEFADNSDNTAPCTFSFHSAFEDPNAPPNAPERKSIEVRCVAFFE